MQIYQSTPDYYRDYIEHGWLKDQAAKVHKYLKRWKNKAGKWVYQYKQPKSNTSYANWNEQRAWRMEGLYAEKDHRTAARGAVIRRYQDIQRARNNAKLKAQKKGNLTSRGFSGSQGSGENQRLRNLGTRKTKYLYGNDYPYRKPQRIEDLYKDSQYNYERKVSKNRRKLRLQLAKNRKSK